MTTKEKTLRLRQLRSAIGFNGKQKATLKALGLGKVGKTRQHPDNREVRAMVKRIPHLVVIDSE